MECMMYALSYFGVVVCLQVPGHDFHFNGHSGPNLMREYSLSLVSKSGCEVRDGS